MTFAVRDDLTGFRSVDSEEDAGPGEHFSYEQPDVMAMPNSREDVYAERDRLLSIAALRIAPLQDAIDLGDASSDESLALTRWKQYRVSVNRVDQQDGFPVSVKWPDQPE